MHVYLSNGNEIGNVCHGARWKMEKEKVGFHRVGDVVRYLTKADELNERTWGWICDGVRELYETGAPLPDMATGIPYLDSYFRWLDDKDQIMHGDPLRYVEWVRDMDPMYVDFPNRRSPVYMAHQSPKIYRLRVPGRPTEYDTDRQRIRRRQSHYVRVKGIGATRDEWNVYRYVEQMRFLSTYLVGLYSTIMNEFEWSIQGNDVSELVEQS